MRNKHVIAAVVITYLIMSFMPGLSVMSLIGKGKGKAAGG
jgi:hypothetical protein